MRKTYNVRVSSNTRGHLDFMFQIAYGADVRKALLGELQKVLGVHDVTVWWSSHVTDNPQEGRVVWHKNDRTHDVRIQVVTYQESLDTCKHPTLSTELSLTKCPDCGEFFVVKLVNIIAASRGGTKGWHFEFLPSNFLGWTCGGGFLRPAQKSSTEPLHVCGP